MNIVHLFAHKRPAARIQPLAPYESLAIALAVVMAAALAGAVAGAAGGPVAAALAGTVAGAVIGAMTAAVVRQPCRGRRHQRPGRGC